MKRNLLPLHRSGWLYLLVGIWVMFFWLVQTDRFESINQVNRNLLQSLLPEPSLQKRTEKPVMHLISPLDLSDFQSIKSLVLRNPQATVVLFGNVSEDLLSELTNWMSQIPKVPKIIVAKEQQTSTSAIEIVSEPLWSRYFLNWYRYPSIKEPQWRTSSQLIFATAYLDKASLRGALATFWQADDKVYPTVLGEILRQLFGGPGMQLTPGLGLDWKGDSGSLQLGASGIIYSTGKTPTPKSLASYLNIAIDGELSVDGKKQLPALIVLGEHSVTEAALVAQVSQQVLGGQYLTQNVSMSLFPSIVLIIGLIGLWLMRSWSNTLLSLWIISLVVLSAVVQYIAFTQMLWVSILPTIVVLIVSGLIGFAYRRECESVRQLYQVHNQLLGFHWHKP